MVIYIVIIIVLASALAVQGMRLREYNRQLLYISRELENVLDNGGHGPILLRTQKQSVKEIVTAVNRCLETAFEKERGFINMQQDLQELTANMSHNLKTPLTALCGYIQLLRLRCQNSLEDAAYIRNIIDKISQKAEQTNHMILQLLDIAKLESGGMELKLQPLDVNLLCGEILLEYYDILEMNGFTVEPDMEESELTALGDREALLCIMKNLIDNAIKYGADGKYLRIRTRAQGTCAAIEVEDHGGGIAPGEQELVFDRAYRGQNAKKHGNGAGLGLAIAKELAVQLRGDLSVISIPKGKTVFTLLLEKC